MARIRSIKPTFASDSKVARLSLQARLTFLLLLPEADDEGRMVGSAKRLVGALYPSDEKIGAAQLERWLAELEREEMVVRYVVDGAKYLAITNFAKHQNPQHPKPSTYPDPPPAGSRHENVENASGQPPDTVTKPSSLSVEGVERELRGRGSIAPAAADAAKPPRPRDVLWDAMLDACGIHEQPTESARGAYNRARKDLAAVGATPEETHRRAAIHRLKWPDISITPSSLARHWAECSMPPTHTPNGNRQAPLTTVERSLRNIQEGYDERRDRQGAGPDGHGLAPARALEAGT